MGVYSSPAQWKIFWQTSQLSGYTDAKRIFEALCAGAVGHLLKNTALPLLKQNILQAAAGGPAVARAFQAAPPVRGHHGLALEPLTARKAKILRARKDGLSYQHIAEHSISSQPTTVGGHPAFLQKPRARFAGPATPAPFQWLEGDVAGHHCRYCFVFTLARRLAGTGVTSVAFYPGLATCRLARNAPWWLKAVTGLMQPWAKNTCDIGVYLATAPEVAQVTGVFFDKHKQLIPPQPSTTRR